MPIPKPHKREQHQAFISRCIAAIHADYDKPGQAAAVCYQSWADAKKAMHENLLKSIRSRTGRAGVMTADRYLVPIQECFNGGFCPTKVFNGATPEQWAKALKDAEQKLTFSSDGMQISQKRIKSGTEVPKGLVMTFDATVTTPKRDRDMDVLQTAGANIDPACPLLAFHNPMLPVGSMLSFQKSPQALRGRFGLADTELGNDCARLIEAKALRISHGFEPTDEEDSYELMEDEKGWLFKKFIIYEVSLVSVPSNTDAVIASYSRGELKSMAIGGWAKKQFDSRPAQGIGFEPPAEQKQVCTCQHTKGVVPYKATAKADQGDAWDGDAAVASLRAWAKGSDSELDLTKAEHRSRYQQGFTIITGDGTNLGDYHLPHHKVAGGTLEVVFRGVSAALGALNGARGGTNLPDQAGAREHLDKHYRQFGQEPPKSAEPSEEKDMTASGMGRCPSCGYVGPMKAFMTDQSGLEDMDDNIPNGGGVASFAGACEKLAASAALAGENDVPAIRKLHLQLRGVLDIAEARQKSREGQEFLTSLGLKETL